eukprot:527313_1
MSQVLQMFQDLSLIEIIETCCVQVITLLQFTLLIISIYQFIRIKKGKYGRFSKLNIAFAIIFWYFTVILSGMFALIVTEWYSISGYFGFWMIDSLIYCEIGAIATNITLINYFASVFMFYLYRLYVTFNGSAFAVSMRTFRFLQIMSFIIYTVSIFSIIYLHIIEARINDNEVDKFCNGHWVVPESIYLKISFQIIIILSNIFYGFFFYDQLSRFLLFSADCSGIVRGNKKIELKKLFRLIHKQTTLVMVSTSSTIIFWSLSNIFYWLNFSDFVQIWILLDIVINSICIWLMFAFNKDCYIKYCVPCQYCSDKSVMLFSYTETLREISEYPSDIINPNKRRLKNDKKWKNNKKANNEDKMQEYDLMIEELRIMLHMEVLQRNGRNHSHLTKIETKLQ